MSTSLAPIPAYGSPEWVAERRQYIGASDVPMILGLSPFGSAYDVWLQKRGLAEVAESDAMRWGHYHEASIAREYQRTFPDVTLEEVGTLPHPKYHWLRATVDRLVTRADGTVLPLEIKSTSEYMGNRWGDVGTDDVPDHVNVQAQVQLMVLGLHFAHVAVLVGHSDCRMPYHVEADRELQQMILDATHDFYSRHVNGGEEPAITGPNTEQHLRKRYATHSAIVRDVSGDEAAVLVEFFQARAARKAAEEWEDAVKPKLLELIGGDYGVKSEAGKALWTATKGRASVDYKGLVAHLNVPEDVIQQYTRTGAPSRSLRCYPIGE